MVALVYSLKDLAGTLAQGFGALLTQQLGIARSAAMCNEVDFTNMWLLCLIRCGCRLLPIVFIQLLPTEKQMQFAVDSLSATHTGDEKVDEISLSPISSGRIEKRGKTVILALI